jgi:MFS family permease
MLTTLRQRNFALLWLGGLISQTGDWLLLIGLPVYIYSLTGSALDTSLLLIVAFLPNILLGSVAGVLVDRWDRRWTMLIANLLLAIGLLPMLLVHDKGSLWILYVALFFESVVDQLVQPAQSALIPQLVSEEQLVTANSLNSVGSSTSRLAGAALGGILLATLGLHSTILLDLISFLFVAAMLWLIKLPASASKEPASSLDMSAPIAPTGASSAPALDVPMPTASASLLVAWKKLGGEWLEGMQLLFRQSALILLFVIFMVTRFGEGVFGVMLVIFVKQVLDSGPIVYGSLLAVQAIGGLLGGLLLAQFGKRLAPARLVGFGFALFGLIDLLIIDLPLFLHSIWLVGLLFILVGIPGTASMVGIQTLLQNIVKDRLRGRIFGALLSAGALMTLLGMVLAGVLGDRLGPVVLLNIQGSGYLLSGVLALLALGRLLAKQAAPEQEDVRGAVSTEDKAG